MEKGKKPDKATPFDIIQGGKKDIPYEGRYKLDEAVEALSSLIFSAGFLVNKVEELTEKFGTSEEKKMMKAFSEKWGQASSLYEDLWMIIDQE